MEPIGGGRKAILQKCLWWYRYQLPDTHTHNTIPLRIHNLCSRPQACWLSVSRHTDYTLQFSLALTTAVSVFVMLWCLDVKLPRLGAWARQRYPPHVLPDTEIQTSSIGTFVVMVKELGTLSACLLVFPSTWISPACYNPLMEYVSRRVNFILSENKIIVNIGICLQVLDLTCESTL
jgi:hypothetical protein